MVTYCEQRDVFEEVPGNREQRLFWPLVEPVDARAIDEGRKAPCSHAQRDSDRREAENHLQQPPHAIDKEAPAIVLRVDQPKAFDLVFHAAANRLDLVIAEEVGNLAGRQQIIHQHQKSLVGHLGVGQEEDHRQPLLPGLDAQLGEVRFEVCEAVAPSHGDLEDLHGADEGSQAAQGLLPAASNANQKRVASRRLQNAADAQDVLYSIGEEDQVHLRVQLVVAVQAFREDMRDVIHAGDGHVFLVANVCGVVTEEVGASEQDVIPRREPFAQLLLGDFSGEGVVLIQVFAVDQLVAVHPLAFVKPEPGQLGFRGQAVGCGEEKALESKERRGECLFS